MRCGAGRCWAAAGCSTGLSPKAPNAPWSVKPPSEAWAESLHGFGWLDHFAALGDKDAKRWAQAAVHHWINTYGRGGSTTAWRPQVTARRLRSWLTHSALLLDGADDRARRTFLRALARQARFVRARWRLAPVGAPRLEAAAGPVYAALCVDGMERGLLDALADLQSELGGQLTPDGGHFSRRPSELFKVFAMTLRLRRDLHGAGGVPTDALTLGIERMTPMLRALRLGDGGLVLFNGGRELSDGRLDYALAEARAPEPARRIAEDAGYGRLASGRTAVVMDAGKPGPGDFSTRAGAGLLAVEASFGRQRVIVNCGPGEHLGQDWANAGRATAAHSALSVEEESALEFLDPYSFQGRWLGSRVSPPYPQVAMERVEDPGGVWLSGSHDAYLRRFGLTHARRLYLSADGGDFRGEDTLTPPDDRSKALLAAVSDRRSGIGFAVRFHIHPHVEVAMAGDVVTLRMAEGGGWTMRQSGGETSIEESVYMGGLYRKPIHAKQIVVRGRVTDYQGRVNWAFRRAGAAAPDPSAEDR